MKDATVRVFISPARLVCEDLGSRGIKPERRASGLQLVGVYRACRGEIGGKRSRW